MLNGKTLMAATVGFCLVAVAWSACWADVTISRHSTMDGMGGLLKSSVTSTESYSGDKMVNDSETKMENKLVKMFGGGKPIKTTSITRLDKELIWNLDHKEKTYTEMTFAEMRALVDSLGSMISGGTDPMAQQEPAIDTAEITFSEPTFEVKRTGKTETISGYNCDQAVMTMTTVGTNRETGETMTLEVMMDLMLAQNVPGSAEIVDFGVRTAQAMGFEMEEGGARSMAKMLEMYGIDAERLAEESRKLEGFAMKTTMSFKMGGDAMEQAQAESEKAEAEQAEQDKQDEARKDEETPTDASGMAAKALGGLFRKEGQERGRREGQERRRRGRTPRNDVLDDLNRHRYRRVRTSRPALRNPRGLQIEKVTDAKRLSHTAVFCERPSRESMGRFAYLVNED